MRKRTPLLAVALASAIMLASIATFAPTPVGATSVTPKLVFGAYVRPKPGESLEQADKRFQNSIGRKLAAVRVYDAWDTPFPNAYTNWLKSNGSTILLSVKAKRNNGTSVMWSNIASAKPGSTIYNQIVKWAKGVKSYGKTVYFIFNHEPEAHASEKLGTPAQFVAAWRKIWNVFHNYGVTNARFTWVLTSWAFEAPSTARQYAPKWYPGDKYVDSIGADAYNWYHCKSSTDSWKTMADAIAGLVAFGALHPKKTLWLAEFGSVEDWSLATSTDDRKADWLHGVESLFKLNRYSQFKGILYYNSQDPHYSKCVWYANTTSYSMNALKRLANDAFFKKFL